MCGLGAEHREVITQSCPRVMTGRPTAGGLHVKAEGHVGDAGARGKAHNSGNMYQALCRAGSFLPWIPARLPATCGIHAGGLRTARDVLSLPLPVPQIR